MSFSIHNIKKNLKKLLPPSLRIHPKIHFMMRWLNQTQYWTAEQQEEWQTRRLQHLITHAYQTVPYYQEVMKERNLKPSDIQCLEDLSKLPILTKTLLKQNPNAFLSLKAKKYCPQHLHTSGSTGEPLYYYLDRNLLLFVQSIVFRHFSWCGIHPTDRIAIFRGTLIDHFGNPQKSLWKREANQLHFSSFQMTAPVLEQFVEQLENFQPALIRGYPSSLEILAKHILNTRPMKCKPTAIHTSSEIVHEAQKETIEKAFGAPLFDWYSHGESTIAAGQCPLQAGFHLNWELGYSEFLPIEKESAHHKILSTCLWNYSMPLIRYETEDLAEITESTLCKCKRKLPLIHKIIGRESDMIFGKNGLSLSPSALVHYWKFRIDPTVCSIQQYQVVQSEDLSIDLYLNSKSPLSESHKSFIQERLQDVLGQVPLNIHVDKTFPSGQKWRVSLQKKEGRNDITC